MSVVQQSLYRRLRGQGMRDLSWRKLLLGCGMAFPVLWVTMDVIASLLYDGYSYFDQTVSELSAIGAPTRTFWMVGSGFYNVLMLAFGVGIWQAAGNRRALRIAACLLIAHAILSQALGPFSSMHQRQVLAAGGGTSSDTIHLVLVGVGSLFFFAEMALAAKVFPGRFRVYTAATALLMLVFGGVTSIYAPDVQANQPTPWLGIYERLSAYAYMLWVVVFAAVLLRRESRRTQLIRSGLACLTGY